MSTSTHLAFALDINGKTYVLSGALQEEKTVLGVRVSELQDLIQTIVGDKGIQDLITPFLPTEMEFRLVMMNGKTEESSYLELIAERSDHYFIRIIKGKDITFFQIWIEEAIGFGQLPLVGEYFDENIGISSLELIYVPDPHANGKIDGVSAIRSAANYPTYDLKLSKAFNLFVGYQDGAANARLFVYPNPIADGSVLQNPATDTGDRLPQHTSTASRIFPIKVNEIRPEIDIVAQCISLSLSAALSISKFSFEVIGLGVKMPFEAFRQPSFKNLLEKASFDIKGLAIRYTGDLFSLTGAFYREITTDTEAYNGLLSFKINKIEIVAVGSYIKTETYSSIFAFGYLGIPIPGHPAFELKGLALGFGLNRSFVMPNIPEIEQFPLLQIIKNNGLSADDRIQDVFGKLAKYIPPKVDSYVIIAGIRFQSFKIVDTIALVALRLDEGITINMLGLSSLTLPKTYHIELAFSLLLDFKTGVAMARGELTPNSYILFPGVKLRGGFAFGLWFAGEQAGDFVISVGGYHPKFNVPDHYPRDISRLGFDIALATNLVISANMYYALTPQCMMVGIEGSMRYQKSVDYEVDLWLVSASVRASVEVILYFSADFIIYWRPFYYEAVLQVSIFASLKVSCSIITLHLEVNLFAALQLWGPDFSGKAYLQVAGYDIEVAFGAAVRTKPRLSSEAFKSAFIPEKVLSITIVQGVVKKVKEGDAEIIVVNPKDFILAVNSQIPISNIQGDIEGVDQMAHTSFSPTYMEVSDQESFHNELTITIDKSTNWRVADVIKQSMPKALWGKEPATQAEALSGEGLVKDLTTGLHLMFPEISDKKQHGNPISLYEVTNFEIRDAGEHHTVSVDPDEDTFEQQLPELQKAASELGKYLALLDEGEEIDSSDLNADVPIYKYSEPIFSYSIWN